MENENQYNHPTEEEQLRNVRRRYNLLMHLVKTNFEEAVYDELQTNIYEDLSTLDAMIEKRLQQYLAQHREIRRYYCRQAEAIIPGGGEEFLGPRYRD